MATQFGAAAVELVLVLAQPLVQQGLQLKAAVAVVVEPIVPPVLVDFLYTAVMVVQEVLEPRRLGQLPVEVEVEVVPLLLEPQGPLVNPALQHIKEQLCKKHLSKLLPKNLLTSSPYQTIGLGQKVNGKFLKSMSLLMELEIPASFGMEHSFLILICLHL